MTVDLSGQGLSGHTAVELVFEIGTEEIPARLLERARKELGERLTRGLDAAGLAYSDVETWATPRRLAITGRVTAQQPDQTKEMLGPPARVAFDEDGNPTKAALGFAKRNGVSASALERKATPKGEYLACTVHIAGQAARDLLPDLLTECITRLHWPKAMRWGSRRETFIRPIHWLTAVLDGQVLPVTWGEITSGDTTRGHRFLAPEPFQVATRADYLDGLRARYVEADAAVRREIIATGARQLADSVGGVAVIEDDLLEEVTGLVEWPVPLLGEFEAEYLALPAQVLVQSMKKHQKYFAVRRPDGSLSNHFLLACGMVVDDPAVVVAGNGRVLRARLADARFFYEQDLKQPLAAFVEQLSGRLFLKGLGTMRDKVTRLEALASTLAARLAPDLSGAADLAGRAGFLAKADLATDMVGEFGDLQGQMGRDYARLAGEPEGVAVAIWEHYLPRHATDDLPSGPIGAAVALADRLDGLVGCFSIGLEPSGSADPYALRRQALGVLRLLEAWSGTAPGLAEALDMAHGVYGETIDADWPSVRDRLLEFFRGRLKASLSQAHPTDLCEAVLAVGHDDPADVRGRLEALHALKGTDDWATLAVGVKRVAKIGADHIAGELDPTTLSEPAAKALYEAWRSVRSAATNATDAGEYSEALAHLATLKPTIDRFFDEVLVMSDEPAERQRRLDLLALVDSLFQRIAAFDRVST